MSDKKVVLITGCSTGFGFESAQALAKRGHSVFATMRGVSGKNREQAQALRNVAETESVDLKVLELDVTSDDSVKEAVAQVVKDAGRIDVLINNAGLGYAGTAEAFTTDEFRAQLDVNVLGPHRMTRAVLPQMREQGSGLLIHVSSVAGRMTMPAFSIYNASKFALEAFAEAIRYELGPLGIESVIVEPGPFSTNFFGNVVRPKDESLDEAYPHIGEFGQQFEAMVMDVFKNPDAPTDASVVVDDFVKLVEGEHGKRPIRTLSGLDFGAQQLNDTLEPMRIAGLEGMGAAEMDKVKVS